MFMLMHKRKYSLALPSEQSSVSTSETGTFPERRRSVALLYLQCPKAQNECTLHVMGRPHAGY